MGVGVLERVRILRNITATISKAWPSYLFILASTFKFRMYLPRLMAEGVESGNLCTSAPNLKYLAVSS